MNINSFKVSQDKSKLILDITDAYGATKLSVWTHKTYKIDSLKIDLSDKLTGATEQTISITLEDLELTKFDGIYFVEVTSSATRATEVTAELTRYRECILNKVLADTTCQECLEMGNPETLNAQTLLYSLELALVERLPQEMLNILSALDKFCGNKCKNCG